ncbi:alpha/beta fold hydrolase [Micromonospora sp. WMMD1082]|uniref:alpha/beta fold hydrolase n=1 Tax=Micromonospora sp. WMMD1082 TaxID=3016104 RepID=UPI002416C23A|nr:alpha/beta fold hydrolase [Micromonospora sp. WMMD1082]MDG4796671.1 alpha/beta fold hydrolase [Micromonospora sp. WMMD1082]
MSSDMSVRSAERRTHRSRLLIALLALIAIIAASPAAVTIVSQNNADATADATPDVAALAGPLADQDLIWGECEFSDDGPPIPGADLSNVECSTIEVPRNWHDPDLETTWEVHISQALNIDPEDPDYHTTIITHPGGPFTSGLSYSATVQMYTPELRPTTNYVSFDQRGLGQSSHASCEYEYDPADGDIAVVQAIGEACSQDPDVATMTTEQAAFDMDFIRHLLGLDSVMYMGYSYGTWIGTWFGSLFADNIERMVFDSSTDSTRASIQHNYDAAHEGRDRQFRLHMMNWIARNDATYGLGADPETIWRRYFAATGDTEMSTAAYYAWTATNVNLAFSSPVGYPFAASLVSRIITEGEAADRPVVPTESAARIIDGMIELTDEQRAAAHERLGALSAPPAGGPGETIRDTYDYLIDFTKCTDGQWEQGLDYWEHFNERTALVAPLSAQLKLLDVPQVCAFWPTESKMPALGDSFPETIVLQSELDSMTPFEQGRAAGTGLPNTSLIAVDNESVHGVFPYGTEEVDRPVIDFLLGGDRPAQTIVAAGKPLPLEQSTFESWVPLDADADHAGAVPQFTDPTMPARVGRVG